MSRTENSGAAVSLLLCARNLSAGYGKKTVVACANLDVAPGEIVTLIGPNGSGKSTLLKTFAAQIPPVAGEIFLLGKNLANLKEKEIAPHISLVMTERIKSGMMTCREVVATGRYPYTNRLGVLSDFDKKKADEAAELVGAAEIASSRFSEVSDGQKQRIMLARAICQDTELVVLDEPTSFLDLRYKIDLMRIIRALAKEKGKAVLMSLHELDLAKAVSDKIVCVGDGKIEKTGAPDEIFTGGFIQNLFSLKDGEFNPETCAVRI